MQNTGDFDEEGLPIYIRTASNFEKMYEEKVANNKLYCQATLSIPIVSA